MYDQFGMAVNLAHKALLSGGVLSAIGKISWDLAGGCERPAAVRKIARTQRKEGARHQWVQVDLAVRCRGCTRCLWLRRAQWGSRGRDEYQQASDTHRRTWLGTLTFNQEARYMLLCRAIKRYETVDPVVQAGLDGDIVYKEQEQRYWDHLNPAEQKKRVTAEVSRELTKYFKRLRNFPRDDWRRKGRKGPAPASYRFRYYAAVEDHADGQPHVHFVMHEADPDQDILHRALTEKWSLGHTNFKLVSDAQGSEYAAKYLGKSKGVRVRASIRYGRVDTLYQPSSQSVRVIGFPALRSGSLRVACNSTPSQEMSQAEERHTPYPPTKGKKHQFKNPFKPFPSGRLLN